MARKSDERAEQTPRIEPATDTAAATDDTAPNLQKVDHIVVLMLENRFHRPEAGQEGDHHQRETHSQCALRIRRSRVQDPAREGKRDAIANAAPISGRNRPRKNAYGAPTS